jgi:hypothetical protein
MNPGSEAEKLPKQLARPSAAGNVGWTLPKLAGRRYPSQSCDDYLDEAHRDNPGTGCAFSALAPEIARSDQQTRALTSEQVRNDIQLIAGLLPGKDKSRAKSRAILTFSALVGAMSLARAVSDEGLSREILETVGQFLKNSVVNQCL